MTSSSYTSAQILAGLNKTDYAVIEALQSHAPNIRPSQGRIAALTGKSIATIRRSIRKLKDHSLVSVERSEQTSKPNTYKLQLKSIATAAAALTGFTLVTVGMLPAALATAPASAPKVAKARPAPPVKITASTAFVMPVAPRSEPVRMECPEVINSTWTNTVTPAMIPADLQPAASQIVEFWNHNRRGAKTLRAFNLQIDQFRKIVEVAKISGLIAQIDKAIFAAQMGNPWQAITLDNFKKYGMAKVTDRNLSPEEKAIAQQQYNKASGADTKHLAPCGRFKSVVKEEAQQEVRKEQDAIYHESQRQKQLAKDAGIEFKPSAELEAWAERTAIKEIAAERMFRYD